MNDTRTFCPRCGGSMDRRGGHHAGETRDPDAVLCDECYLAEFDLIDAPDRVDVRVCARCGAVHRGNRWVDVGAQDLTDVAIEVVTEALRVHVEADDISWGVEPEQIDPNTIEMHCRFSGSVRDTPVEVDVDVPVYVARETCTRCGRIAGDYYASVIQVRARDRTPTPNEVDRAVEIAQNFVADREAAGDRDAFITEVTRNSDGLDLKLSDTKLGRAIATRIQREFGGEISDSETLVGEDEDGNEMYRVTFAVRLPAYVKGDVIEVDDDGPVLVRSGRGTLSGVRLTTGEPFEASYGADVPATARKLGTRTDGQETVLVAVEDETAVQVIDPETYEPKTIPRPDYLDPEADTVPVLKSRAGLHVLPETDG